MYSYFPPYQAPLMAQLPQVQVPQLSQTQGIQYVDGKKSVESYQMPVNSSAIFLDSSEKKFYTKHTDANGVATIKAYDYMESEEDKPVEYVTKKEFESFKQKLKGGNKNESVVRKQYDDASNGGNDAGRKS